MIFHNNFINSVLFHRMLFNCGLAVFTCSVLLIISITPIIIITTTCAPKYLNLRVCSIISHNNIPLYIIYALFLPIIYNPHCLLLLFFSRIIYQSVYKFGYHSIIIIRTNKKQNLFFFIRNKPLLTMQILPSKHVHFNL